MGFFNKRKASPPRSEKPKKLTAVSGGRWRIANLQGIGKRESQQDAFGMSQLKKQNDSFFLIVSDGMGGIADGGIVAAKTVADLSAALSGVSGHRNFADILDAITKTNDEVFANYHENGGATLVCCYISGRQLSFACAGDSYLYLLRGGILTQLNRRHNHYGDLLEKVLDDKISVAQAQQDEQGSALSSFIGVEEIRIDHTARPIPLCKGDVLLLCSDGICDALAPERLGECLLLPPADCCERLEREIEAANLPSQDNYTAIVAALI